MHCDYSTAVISLYCGVIFEYCMFSHAERTHSIIVYDIGLGTCPYPGYPYPGRIQGGLEGRAPPEIFLGPTRMNCDLYYTILPAEAAGPLLGCFGPTWKSKLDTRGCLGKPHTSGDGTLSVCVPI